MKANFATVCVPVWLLLVPASLLSCGDDTEGDGAALSDDDAPAPSTTGPEPSVPEPSADDDVMPADDDVADDDVMPADDDVADDDVADDDVVPADDDVADDDVADDDVADDDTADDDIGDDDVVGDAGPGDDDVVPEPDASMDGLGHCEVPEGATVIADYQLFNPDGGPSYGIVSDGTTVYVAFVDRVVAIPQAGGEPTEVYQSDYGVSLYDHGGDSFLLRSGSDWFDLADSMVTAAPFPGIEFPGLSVVYAVKDADTIWVRGDDLYYRIATYGVLDRGEAEAREIVAEVLQGTGGPLLVEASMDSALVQKAPLDTTDPEFDAFTFVSEAGEFTSAAVTEGGEPFLLTANHVYYDRTSTAPEEELGLWRAAVVPEGFESPTRLGALTGIVGAEDGGLVAIHSGSSLAVVSDTDAEAELVELAVLDTRNDAGDACASHGLALAGGEVVTTLYHQHSDETVIFKLPVP